MGDKRTSAGGAMTQTKSLILSFYIIKIYLNEPMVLYQRIHTPWPVICRINAVNHRTDMSTETVTLSVGILEMLAGKLSRLERREIRSRFQVVVITKSGEPESHFWEHDRECAYSAARVLRKRYPDAIRIVVYDHNPKSKEF